MKHFVTFLTILALAAPVTPVSALSFSADDAAATASSVPVKHQKANYELAAQWSRQKVGKLIFDTSVTPRWLDSGDRFWYTFENNKGRKFWLVDPVKKTKSPVFDPVKLA